jgi:hypothetical protein
MKGLLLKIAAQTLFDTIDAITDYLAFAILGSVNIIYLPADSD